MMLLAAAAPRVTGSNFSERPGNKTVHNNKPAAAAVAAVAAAGKEQKENPEEDRRGDEFLMREPSEGWRGE
jgi:hypothetical protein